MVSEDDMYPPLKGTCSAGGLEYPGWWLEDINAGVGARESTLLRTVRFRRRRRRQHSRSSASRARTTSGTTTPMTILAQSGRPPSCLVDEVSAFVVASDAAGVDDVALAVEETGVVEEAVVDADVEEGPNSPLKYFCTSVGSAVNQSGVWSSKNSDHSNRDTAGTSVSAMARIDGGTPVTRT